MTADSDSPYKAPETSDPSYAGKKRNYEEVPWLRKSGTNTFFIIVHVLTCGALPLMLLTCIMLVTGSIYYKETLPEGTLKTWSKANAVIAFLVLLVPMILLGTVVLTIAGY